MVKRGAWEAEAQELSKLEVMRSVLVSDGKIRCVDTNYKRWRKILAALIVDRVADEKAYTEKGDIL